MSDDNDASKTRKWKLTPMHLDHPNWDASTSLSPLTVEADNETEARRKANSKYFQATGRRVGENVKTSPWLDRALVDCTELAE